MWDLSPQPGIEPTSPALEGKVLTTGLPEKSLILVFISTHPGDPRASLVAQTKESACNTGLDPWVGEIPWRRKWQHTPVFLVVEFRGQRSLAGYSPWGRKELDMT